MNKITKFLPLAFSIVAIVIALLSKSPSESDAKQKNLTIADVITPGDLGIKKHVFRAKPAKDEVVLLECEMHYDGKLVKKIINYIHTDQKIHEEPLLIIRKDTYNTFEEEEAIRKRFNSFDPERIEIICSGFIENLDHLHFKESHVSTGHFSVEAGKYSLSSSSNSAKFHFMDNREDVAKAAGIQCSPVDFYFTMKTISYAEAKQRQPKLEPIEATKGWTYQDVEYGEDQPFPYQKARDASMKSQLEFQR